MTRSMYATLGAPSTPCILGKTVFDHIEHPGPIVSYVYQGFSVPVWAAEFFPSVALTPVRMSDVEKSISAMAERIAATTSSTADILDAILNMRDALRSPTRPEPYLR